MKYNKNDHHYARRWAKKIKAINYLGGKCYKCGIKDPFVLDFHHQENKEFQLCNLLGKDSYWNIIEKELNKCILLCGNCHCENHNVEADERTNLLKSYLLEYKNINKCEECGYITSNLSGLSFHHIGEKDMLISTGISKAARYDRHYSEDLVIKNLKKEIDKCIVLCINCHRKRHINNNKYERFKKLIINKSETLKQKKWVDRDEVMRLNKLGMEQKEIAKLIGCGQSCISKILKKENL